MKLRIIILIGMIISLNTLFSCKKFVEIEAPKSSLVPATVYKSDDLASAVVLGIYQRMAASGYGSGDANSISTICGLTADEFVGHNAALKLFFDNQVIKENGTIAQVWTNIYQRIYESNALLEGLQTSEGITPSVKTQLQGEVYFTRAFHYFYLVNIFGSVPLYLTTDYKINSVAAKNSVDDVYTQIIKDLKAAEALLTDKYITTERIRPNLNTVYALFSRVYLYNKDWENAEKYANLIITKSNTYKLVGLDDIFLSNSLETIWQVMPPANTNSAASFMILANGIAPTAASLRPDFAEQAFEANDLRKIAWIKNTTNAGVKYYYPFKYKVLQTATIVKEYTMVFRLAEQYLIRAEARAQRNNLSGAIDDLDAIRTRAGLLLIKNENPGITKDNLLNAIQKERKIELFAEWGHRWFDLKRINQSTAVLGLSKHNWKSNFVIFPIPKTETDLNTNIIQNEGY